MSTSKFSVKIKRTITYYDGVMLKWPSFNHQNEFEIRLNSRKGDDWIFISLNEEEQEKIYKELKRKFESRNTPIAQL